MALTKDVPAACRFVGVRLDEEIVLLDRDTNSLIHLNPAAVLVWEACASPDGGSDYATAHGGDDGTEAASVRAALENAGILCRANDGYVRASVEWA
jgi:hypothetical protein